MRWPGFTDDAKFDIPYADQDVLGEYGQFHATDADLKFLRRLLSGKPKRRERDEWFEANERRPVWCIAQGILASVYGEDPP